MLGTDSHRCDDISNFPQIHMKRYRQFYGYYNPVKAKKHPLTSVLPGVREYAGLPLARHHANAFVIEHQQARFQKVTRYEDYVKDMVVPVRQRHVVQEVDHGDEQVNAQYAKYEPSVPNGEDAASEILPVKYRKRPHRKHEQVGIVDILAVAVVAFEPLQPECIGDLEKDKKRRRDVDQAGNKTDVDDLGQKQPQHHKLDRDVGIIQEQVVAQQRCGNGRRELDKRDRQQENQEVPVSAIPYSTPAQRLERQEQPYRRKQPSRKPI